MQTETGPVAAPGATGAFQRRVQAYVRMGRTIRWENFLGTPLWWALLPGGLAADGRTAVLVALTALVYVAMVAVTGTLDDVQGYRDGSDLANYRRSDPTGLRPMTRKPLLLGWVTERQAVRYAGAAALTCGLALLAAWLVAGGGPGWLAPVWVAVLLAGFQYSAGLRLSYVGAQELTLWTIMFGSVAFPYVLVTGELPGGVAAVAATLGIWFVQVSMCSNTHDVDGDRAVGRRTLAVLVGEAAHRRAIALVVASGWSLAAVATEAGWWSPWQLAGLAPAVALHLRQLTHLYRGRPLEARATGFMALRLGVAGLFLTSLAVR